MTRRRVGLLVGIGVVFVFLAVGGIATWEYTNSSEFCTTFCHDVHPEETEVYQDSYHARVKCVECHTGRISTLEAIALKGTHFVHLVDVITGNYERPLVSVSMRPANESCGRCHWPESFHDDTVREKVRFASDEANTEERTYLIMRVGGGTAREGRGKGIHWHIENEIRYIATDEQAKSIPWVQVNYVDGQSETFVDAANPLSAADLAAAEIHTMDCADCHNRIGHPFPPPEDLVDEALADGRLSRELPYVKRDMMALLTESHDNLGEALDAVGKARSRYVADYPELSQELAAQIDQAEELAEELLERLVFEEEGITWQSFPDHQGHKEFAGCFRCHDGKHVTDTGESVRLHCNICHSLPVTVGEQDRPPDMPVSTLQEPASHLEANFIADHRFQANVDCVACHGQVEFGYENDSFCGNEACHGNEWPSVNLDAAFPHPIELQGKHAETWCHDCHEGVKKPEYECSNCHEPPTSPHFGDDCAACHTPVGFELASMPPNFEHPIQLVGVHAETACTTCHGDGRTLSRDCSTCHQPPTDPHFGADCEQCHTPLGFGEALMPESFEHPIPLVGNHAALNCSECHQDGVAVGKECRDCHMPPGVPHFGANCETCHQPVGWDESAGLLVSVAQPMAHALAGNEACLRCHDEGGLVPRPDDHLGRPQETCTVCHQEGVAAPAVTHDLDGREKCLLCHAVGSAVKPAPQDHEGRTEDQCLSCHQPG